jgi:exopolysaccharide biosynthesis polyprenyl glycosylphosphotransferase
MPGSTRQIPLYGKTLFVQDVVSLYLLVEIVPDISIWGYNPVILTFIEVMIMAGIIAVTIIGLAVGDLYSFNRNKTAFQMASGSLLSVLITSSVIASLLYLTKLTDLYSILWRGNLVYVLLLFALWSSIIRYISYLVVDKTKQPEKWLVIGSKAEEILFEDKSMNEARDHNLINLPVDDNKINDLELTINDHLVEIYLDNKEIYSSMVTGIIIEKIEELPDHLISQLMSLRLKGITIFDLASYFEFFYKRIPVLNVGPHQITTSEGYDLLYKGTHNKVKRTIDLVVSLFAILILLPFGGLIFLLVHYNQPGTVIYKQKRVGLNGVEFYLYKIRTMIENAETEGAQWSSPDDPRVTKIGRILRRTRVDEIPQLWNILKGDMSIVGPRPERKEFVNELEQLIPYYDLRLMVKPGLTGWAQVMFPYGSTREDARKKLDYDLYYLKHFTITFDLLIMFKTIRVVLTKSGI